MSSAKLAATTGGGLSTFLLEVALDEARLRERFAALLREWRTSRGHGDPQRFPQQQAAAELGTGYRTYQSWEAAIHLPRRWSDIEHILEVIGVPTSVLLDDVEPQSAASSDADLGLEQLDAGEVRGRFEGLARIIREQSDAVREEIRRLEPAGRPDEDLLLAGLEGLRGEIGRLADGLDALRDQLEPPREASAP